MFSYIIGDISEIGEDYIVIDNHGIGYFINTSKNTICNLKDKLKGIKVHTHFHVREDGISIYGFISKEELEMFKLLLLVSKIGPKVALGILSSLTPDSIKQAILNEDIKLLSTAQGIGLKTGKRIVLELKDKIKDDIFTEISIFKTDSFVDEAVGALISLGYSRSEINNVLSKTDTSGLKTEEIIKIALKKLSTK
ncbi:ATP-dependent DNA helicase RuvA [Caloranaerobacter sp. TR13]|uniref:Holliday junction branch migration protein RuvA n=1 Tax=Caloranaerobacter sp. TR13 TaxID=1302151 RepID=UPI0006D47D71|nr:Holliday junction branch migration protein RuvA [Caloranaerobacter sp. TR13]KPU28003.1 ATP-dependent DNA helicase RuvA [Caloranaerobacter sp. TR13]